MARLGSAYLWFISKGAALLEAAVYALFREFIASVVEFILHATQLRLYNCVLVCGLVDCNFLVVVS